MSRRLGLAAHFVKRTVSLNRVDCLGKSASQTFACRRVGEAVREHMNHVGLVRDGFQISFRPEMRNQQRQQARKEDGIVRLSNHSLPLNEQPSLLMLNAPVS